MKKILDNIVFKIVTGIIKVCFICIIILYLSFIIIQRMTGNNSVFGYRLFTVATGSMAGVYDINDVIAVKDYDISKLKIGDDIAYRGNKGGLEGMLITHIIINIEDTDKGRLFTTKGVNSLAEDPKIEESQILGKVVGVVPIITQINHIVKTQLGFFLLVFCPLVLIIVLEVLQTITDIKVEKNELKLIEKKKKSTKEVEKVEKKEEVVEKKKEDEIEIL